MNAAGQLPGSYFLAPGQGVAGFDANVKASKLSTGGALTMIESRTAGGAPWHVHSREDEFLYVVSGKLLIHCGENEFNGEPGAFVYLPRGVAHAWDVVSDEKAVVLMMTVPAMLESFLQEFHAVSGQNAKDQVAEKYGIRFLAKKP